MVLGAFFVTRGGPLDPLRLAAGLCVNLCSGGPENQLGLRPAFFFNGPSALLGLQPAGKWLVSARVNRFSFLFGETILRPFGPTDQGTLPWTR